MLVLETRTILAWYSYIKNLNEWGTGEDWKPAGLIVLEKEDWSQDLPGSFAVAPFLKQQIRIASHLWGSCVSREFEWSTPNREGEFSLVGLPASGSLTAGFYCRYCQGICQGSSDT